MHKSQNQSHAKLVPKHWLYLLVVISVFLILSTVLLFQNLNSLQNDFVGYKEKMDLNYFNLVQENNLLLNDLNKKNNDLSQLQIKKNSLENINRSIKDDLNTTLKKIDIYKKELTDSMQWFSKNSQLDYTDPNQKKIIQKIDRAKEVIDWKDYGGEGESCVIRLEDSYFTNNLAFLNSRELNLKYLPDSENFDKNDFLQPLTNFSRTKNGDCEDWSLLHVAELRYLYEKCEKEFADEILVGYNSFLPNDENYNKFYVVCGTFTHYDTGEEYGHCVTLLTYKEISSLADLNNMQSGVFIESQTGEQIQGRFKFDNNLYRFTNYQADDEKLCLYNQLYTSCYYYPKDFSFVQEGPFDFIIDTIIIENDLLYFSIENQEWFSYSKLLLELEQKQKLIESKLNQYS